MCFACRPPVTCETISPDEPLRCGDPVSDQTTDRGHDVAAVHRLQGPLPVAYVCYALWGAAYVAGQLRQLATGQVVAAAVANVLLLMAGLALNTLADMNDDRHDGGKNALVAAARRIGRTRLWRWVIVEGAAGLVLAGGVTVTTGRWLPTVAGLLTAGAHWLYNWGPAPQHRGFKHRGFSGAVVFGMTTGTLPCLLSAGAIRSDIPANVWLMFLGLGLYSAGRTAWWSVPDVEADRAVGAGTPSGRHGVARTAARSSLIMLAGLLTLAVAPAWRYGPWWACAAVVHLVVLAIALGPVLPTPRLQDAPIARWLRTHLLDMVVVGEALILAVPLAHLA